MMVGDVAYPFFVPVPPCEVVVLHRDDLPLARAPRASFDAEVARAREATGQALAEASRRAFVAAVVIARDDPGAAIEAAATALEVEGTPGPLSTALCAALARATGEPLGFSRGEWLWWWRSHKPRPARGQSPVGTETPPPGG
jgi:hypothetical protein